MSSYDTRHPCTRILVHSILCFLSWCAPTDSLGGHGPLLMGDQERIQCIYTVYVLAHWYMIRGDMLHDISLPPPKVRVMRSRWFVCHSFGMSLSVQDYCKSNQPIFLLKLGVIIGLTYQKKTINFWWWSVPANTDHFSTYLAIGE